MNLILRYSTIQDYLKCPRLFEYKHIMGIPEGGQDSADLRFGSALHLALEAELNGEDGLSIFYLYWAGEKDKGLKYTKYQHADLETLGEIFLDKFKRLHKKHFAPIHQELKMETRVGPLPFQGTLDLYGDYKGVRSIVDFKTSARPYPKEKIMVNEQMPGYIKMLKERGLHVNQAVYMTFVKDLKDPRIQVTTQEVTDEWLAMAYSNISQTAYEIRGAVPPNKEIAGKTMRQNRSQCVNNYGDKCPYFDRCHVAKKKD